MKVSVTVSRDDVGLGIFPAAYKKDLKLLFDRADEKSGGFITITAELPKRHGTDAENRAFHSLVGCYWESGCASDASFEDIKERIKLQVVGAEYYIFISDKQHIVRSIEMIPKGHRYIEIPKSWTEFTRDERASAIKYIIIEMTEAGVNTKKFQEICAGLEK